MFWFEIKMYALTVVCILGAIFGLYGVWLAMESYTAYSNCDTAKNEWGLEAYVIDHTRCYAEIDGVITKLN